MPRHHLPLFVASLLCVLSAAQTPSELRSFREKLLSDPARPAYHFAIPEDHAAPFDPNGCIWWNGRCHMFYIYQDEGVHVYGHVSSTDLVHWRQHPKALYPVEGSSIQGMFSGNCFIGKDGEAVMLFHGVGQGNSIALSSDPLLENWFQLPSNPIVPDPKDRPAIAHEQVREKTAAPYASWDPHGWLEGDTYYAIFGGKRPAVFKSETDLESWSYVGDLFGSYLEDVPATEDVSCPDLFHLGDRDVLFCISHDMGCRYYIGQWRNEKFWPESHGRMSFSDNAFFAPESMALPDGRRVVWAWLSEGRSREVALESGWSGVMSLPREVFMNKEDHSLGMRPAGEVLSLRYNSSETRFKRLEGRVALDVPGGDLKEIVLDADMSKASKVGLRFLDDGASEYGEVYYDTASGAVTLDVSRLNAIQGAERTSGGGPIHKVESAPFRLGKKEKLRMDVFMDRSVVEVFINERLALVRPNAFASKTNPGRLSVFAEGGTAAVNVLSWDMMPANQY